MEIFQIKLSGSKGLKQFGGFCIDRNPGTFSKLVRMENEGAFIESGLVWLPELAPWLEDFENEIVLFPNGKNDDQVDAMSQYLKRDREKSYTGKTPPPPVGDEGDNYFGNM